MNRTRIVDSDDEADESMPKSPGVKNGASSRKLQHRQQKVTGSDDNSNSLSGNMDEEKQEVATSTSSRVGDLRIVTFVCLLIVTKVVVDSGRRVKNSTKDIRICGKDGKGAHPFNSTLVDGWYCRFC